MIGFLKRLTKLRAAVVAIGFAVFTAGAWFVFPKPVPPPQYGRSFSVFDWYRVALAHDGMAPTLVAGDSLLVQGRAPKTGEIALCLSPEGDEYVIGRVLAAGRHTLWTDEAGRLQVRYPVGGLRGVVEGPEREVTFRDRPRTVERLERPRPAMVGPDGMEFEIMHGDAPLQVEQVRIPEDHVFLLGDNREAHEYDSRAFGPVSVDGCLGVITFRTSASPDGAAFGNEWGWVD